MCIYSFLGKQERVTTKKIAESTNAGFVFPLETKKMDNKKCGDHSELCLSNNASRDAGKSNAVKFGWTGFLYHLHHRVRKSKFLRVLLVCLHLFALRSLEK